MRADPDYLSNLGELATLKNTLAAYFHQDWSLDSGSEEEVWREIVRANPQDYLGRLVEQIDALLLRSDDAIQQLFRQYADGLPFETAADGRQFLEVFQIFVRTYGVLG